jgi:hypothetical protein
LNKRGLVIALGLVGIAIGITSILLLSTLTATIALPLSDAGMIIKANALPEVKAFIEKYPNYSIGAGHPANGNADGYVDFRIGDAAYQDKTRHGYQKFDNILLLAVLFNRSSGEIVEVSLECDANIYHTEFGRPVGEHDPNKSFHFTSAEKNVLEYIQQQQDERCFKSLRPADR